MHKGECLGALARMIGRLEQAAGVLEGVRRVARRPGVQSSAQGKGGRARCWGRADVHACRGRPGGTGAGARAVTDEQELACRRMCRTDARGRHRVSGRRSW
ncbi:hypothetical protein CRG98_046517 [Punica granatum]|uniref:Uncharacterized protein n=1 Tax=Punica granatum TaxID=22663 RepID=A0A2I0HMZ7_PUNGR|nr:hypothetical protein CRG98_046517 [Punica granatum]